MRSDTTRRASDLVGPLVLIALIWGAALAVAIVRGPEVDSRSDGAQFGFALAAVVALPFVFIGALVTVDGLNRNAALRTRFPDAVVIRAGRYDETRVAFERLAHRGWEVGHRLPASYSAVVEEGGVSLWVGGARRPRRIARVPAMDIAAIELDHVRINNWTRPVLVVSVGDPAIRLPIGAIGAGFLGFQPLIEDEVAGYVAECRRVLAIDLRLRTDESDA